MLDLIDDIKELFYKKKIIIVSMFIVIILGLLFGSIYITIFSNNDKKELLDNISNYFNNFKDIDFSKKLIIFKESLIKNIIYFIILWGVGISIVGIPITYIMIYYKSFILGFSIAGIFAKYKINGLLKILLYIFPGKILILVLSIIIGVFGVSLSIKLVNTFLKKDKLNFSVISGKYTLLLLISILVSILTAGIDAFILPILYNLI